ncbi:MAG: glycosyltransferase [Clostridia bacterium]|nr:glycosyltransferase [Clostridia bacterium]
MKKIKLELLQSSHIDFRKIKDVYLIYGINGWNDTKEEKVRYECIDNGKYKALYAEIYVPDNSVVDYYYKVVTDDGEVIVENNGTHNYSIGVESYLNLLESSCETRSTLCTAEIQEADIPPVVSIVIPVYNNSKFLPLAIESVLNQDFKSYELIIVNDGSTEDIDRAMMKYSNLQNIIYIKLDKNYGCAYARNYGLKLARGKYMGWLDSDDVYMPSFLRSMVDILDNDDQLKAVFSYHYDYIPHENLFQCSNLIWCPYCTNFDENDNPIPKPNKESFCAYTLCQKCGGTGAVHLDRYDFDLLKANCYLVHPASLVRKSLYDDNSGYDIDFHVASDWDFWSRSLNEYNGFLLAKPLLIKRLHKNSIWQKLRKERTHSPSYFREIIKNKIKIRDLSLQGTYSDKSNPDFLKGKRVVIYPYNKEVNNLILFRELLDFKIEGVIDYIIEKNGDLGEIIFGKRNGIEIVSNEDKAKEMVRQADAILMFDVPEPEYDMKKYYTKAQTSRFWYELFETALDNSKDVYSTSYLLGDIVNSAFYRDYVNRSKIRYFYPEITYAAYIDSFKAAQNYEYNYMNFEPKLIAFFGIAPNVGKFSSQIMLTQFLKDKGHKVQHISTEPYGDLFGSITACNERFDNYHFKKWFRGKLDNLNNEKYDFIITGGQGDYFVDVSQRLISCVFPRKFDYIFLVAGMQETDEQIAEAVNKIRHKSEISAIILPLVREVNFHEYKRYRYDDFLIRKRNIEEKTGIKVLEFYHDKKGLEEIYNIIQQVDKEKTV